MTNTLMINLGLENIDISYIFIGIFAVLILVIVLLIVSFIKLNKLRKRYEKFMEGKDAKSLEKEIFSLRKENNLLIKNQKNNKDDINNLYEKVKSTFQKVGLVRYDAYQQLGGMLSFSLVLLDEENNGFVLNSVHSSDSCYTYTKEIVKGNSKIELGNEEKVALEQAINKNL